MLSKTEIEFLKNPERFDANYRRVMRHRVKAKTEEFRAQIALLQGYMPLEGKGLSVTENSNGVTEFCNGQKNQQGLNQVAFKNPLELGMGIEPIYNSSAGCRLNHSATPAP